MNIHPETIQSALDEYFCKNPGPLFVDQDFLADNHKTGIIHCMDKKVGSKIVWKRPREVFCKAKFFAVSNFKETGIYDPRLAAVLNILRKENEFIRKIQRNSRFW